jgi:hypothetical protein
MKKLISSVFCVLVFFSIASLSFAMDLWLDQPFPPDSAPYPTVVSVSPAHGAVLVPIGSSIVIQFSMQMYRPSVEYEVGLEDQYGNFIPGTFAWSSTVFPDDTVTFTPAQDLDYSQTYEIYIGADCYDAINYYPLNGYWEAEVTYFSTAGAPGDDSPPEVITVLPYDGQVGGDTHDISALFTKPLDPATLTTANVVLSGPGISSWDVGVDYDPYVITITPDTALASNSVYTVTLTTGLTDTEGHHLASNYQWSFDTGEGDTTPPVITQTIPADGATDTAPWAAVQLYFSENMNASTISTSTVTVYDETASENSDIHLFAKDVELGNRSRISIWPVFGSEWSEGHTYTVTVSGAVADVAGNTLGSDYTLTFTVVGYPEYAPELWVENWGGVRMADGDTMVHLSLWADGAEGPDYLTVKATDLTQTGKEWYLTNYPGSNWFEYDSTGDEGLTAGYHTIEFEVKDTYNGHVTTLGLDLYVFNASPSLTAPANAASGISLTPSLSWSSSGIANDDLYAVAVFDGPDPSQAKIVWTTYIIADGSPSYTVTIPACRALEPGTEYSWAVMAMDNHYWPQGEADSQLWSFTTADPCECDLNADGRCDMLDWLLFGEDWGRTDCGTPPGSGNPPNDCECDLNADGRCDMLDWLLFGEDWGRTDCPIP